MFLPNGQPTISIWPLLLLRFLHSTNARSLRRLQWLGGRPRHLLRRRWRLRHNGYVKWIYPEDLSPLKLTSFIHFLTFLLTVELGFCRRSVWVWELVQPGVRNQHSGAEHRAVQQWAELRSLFRNAMRQRPQVVPPWLDHRHCNQLLPPQLRFGQQQWRVVQPSSPTLRPRGACLPPNCTVPRWHRPCCLQKVGLLPTTSFYDLSSLLLLPVPAGPKSKLWFSKILKLVFSI